MVDERDDAGGLGTEIRACCGGGIGGMWTESCCAVGAEVCELS